MGRKRGEQPGLVVVGDNDLVVSASALLVDQAAEELDALAGIGALAQDDAAVAVLADAGSLIDWVCCFGNTEMKNPPLFGKCINSGGDDNRMNIIPMWNYFFRRWITLIA